MGQRKLIIGLRADQQVRRLHRCAEETRSRSWTTRSITPKSFDDEACDPKNPDYTF